MSAHTLDQAASVFFVVRPRLFGIAYRIVGNAPEAEDIVQEVWLRWQRTDRSAVIDPAAFLATTTTRLAINLVKCARRRHETYVATWLPEESASDGDDPHTQAERNESIDLAARVLLERLSPAERASYVLREGFEYPYQRIAEKLRIGAPNARQLVKRARDRLASDRRRPFTQAAHSQLVQALVSASRAGDLADLEDFLTAGLAEQAA
ncbi:sigma-70 family RNA polymerase sigma factor [Kribbella sp. NPDC050124]|uniref:sigma-70 family RNA polymerase sigma factor n=1 Tax=Kribbella sp. NPDC050124 TaxID=3364114 RepID=UPI0037872F6E